MKTNKRHSTKNNKALTGLSKLKNRSEQLSGNGKADSRTEKTTSTELTPGTQTAAPETASAITEEKTQPTAPAANSQPSTLNSQTPQRILPFVDFQQRELNRALATDEVLGMLCQWLPAVYDLAEVVGKWVWVAFPEPPAEHTRGQLSQFGFHWNNLRKCWQHPCGQFSTEGSAQDPRKRYGSHYAADLRAA